MSKPIKIGASSDTNGQLLFIEQIRAYDKPINIKAVTATDIMTTGLVKIKFQASQGCKTFFD